uniref:Vacuolar protein sorting-associated protein 51 homolog n=1 Tax=Glossina pallidipes TaxID=7398 RepID=A0A1A9ZU31_GLOPL
MNRCEIDLLEPGWTAPKIGQKIEGEVLLESLELAKSRRLILDSFSTHLNSLDDNASTVHGAAVLYERFLQHLRTHSDTCHVTLIYENYNKFILATDTIRKMKNGFKQMETDMNLLKDEMSPITSFSEQLDERAIYLPRNSDKVFLY